MTTTSSTSSTSSTTTSASTSDTSSLSDTFSEFLTLLTTQLQNQDPLDPMDSSTFTQQLVEYSQVEQQIKTNSYLENLSSMAQTNETVEALGYVGLQIQYEGDSFAYTSGSSVTFNYDLDSEASITNVTIKNSDGDTVYTTTGESAEGSHSITWDGKDSDGDAVDAGTYTVVVSALDSDGKTVKSTTTVPGYITGIQRQTDGSVKVIVNNTEVALDDITTAKL